MKHTVPHKLRAANSRRTHFGGLAALRSKSHAQPHRESRVSGGHGRSCETSTL